MTPDFEHLLEAIYEGPFEEVPWTALSVALGNALDTEHVGLFILQLRNVDRAMMLIKTADTQWADLNRDGFFADYIARDPFVDLSAGTPVTLDELMSDQELKHSEYYLHCLEPEGIEHALGLDVRLAGGLELKLRLAREAGQPGFSADDKALCRRIAPHLLRSLKVFEARQRVESQQTMYASLTDQVAGGVILLDAEGAVVQTNRAAQELFARGDLKQRDGRLYLEDTTARDTLNQAIIAAGKAQDERTPAMVSALRLNRGSGGALNLVIRTLPASGDDGARPVLMLFITRPEERKPVSPDLIGPLFGLTPTEAMIASLLAQGTNVAEIASDLGTSIYTVRAHVRSIFAKTGVSKQSELVRRVLISMPALH